MKKSFVLFAVCFSALLLVNPSFAQTVEELTTERDTKASELTTLETELEALTGKVEALKTDVATLTDKITPYPRWSTGLLGTVGLNVAGFNNWLSKEKPNTTATTIGLTAGAFANLDQKKYFWRNGGNLALSWLKFNDKDVDPDPGSDADEFQVAADALNVTSLFGYKLNEKLAISALGEYRTSTLGGKFNDPGYLDIGAGATWTPIPNLVAVFHPLNYNIVFSEEGGFEYQSSLGLKMVVDYSAKLTKSIAWRSNLSTFTSYKSADPSLSNWTWVNTFSTAYKGIGIGLDLGFRNNQQETAAFNLGIDNPNDMIENKIQTYYVLGLAYNLTSN